MRVDFFTALPPDRGDKTIEVEIEHETTVREVLEAIVTRFPPLRR